MSPLTPTTITRLDPRRPLLWRDGDTLQFGLEGEIHVQVDRPWIEPLLLRLRQGIRLSTFDVVAHGLGAPRAAARELLERLRPVLLDDPPPAASFWVEQVNVADERAPARMTEALVDEGLFRGRRDDPDDVGVIVVGGAAAALQLAPYLRDDVTHLPVSFEHTAVTVGPLVVPGQTPCLTCRDAHERDRDPAWPLLHTQLVGARMADISAARIVQAASLVARILRTPVTGAGMTARLRPDGRRAWRSVRFHEACLCRDPSSRSRRGTATETDPPARTNAPTTPRAFARPA